MANVANERFPISSLSPLFANLAPLARDTLLHPTCLSTQTKTHTASAEEIKLRPILLAPTRPIRKQHGNNKVRSARCP